MQGTVPVVEGSNMWSAECCTPEKMENGQWAAAFDGPSYTLQQVNGRRRIKTN